MIPYQRELVTIAINEELRKEYWQACEERKQYALSNFEELKNADDATRARFIELWRDECLGTEEYIIVTGERCSFRRFSGKELSRHLKNQAVRDRDKAMEQLRRELELAQARKDGYEDGRKDGIVEVFNRDKKNLEKGLKFAETKQGKKQREKAELCDAACEAYHDAMQTERPISWKDAVKCAAKKHDRKITNLRSKAEMARLWYPGWREKHVRKRDSNPKP